MLSSLQLAVDYSSYPKAVPSVHLTNSAFIVDQTNDSANLLHDVVYGRRRLSEHLQHTCSRYSLAAVVYRRVFGPLLR